VRTQVCQDLGRIGVLARTLLRVDKLIAQHHLESAALRGDENYFV
jgi:hypothetical protein